jgi:hypothetical protein
MRGDRTLLTGGDEPTRLYATGPLGDPGGLPFNHVKT